MSILIYLATIFWSLFPNLIHVFQGGEDFINKVNETNLIVNGDFSDGKNNWVDIIGSSTIINEELVLDTTQPIVVAQNGIDLKVTDKIYTFYYAYESVDNSGLRYYYATNTGVDITNGGITNNALTTTKSFYSSIITLLSNATGGGLYLGRSDTARNGNVLLDNIGSYNITNMMTHGVKNDNGILFSDLTNEQIKNQLDTWIIDHGDLSFTITKDNTFDSWFNTGFVDKTAERDFLDYLGYFAWLFTPPILLFISLDLIRRIL